MEGQVPRAMLVPWGHQAHRVQPVPLDQPDRKEGPVLQAHQELLEPLDRQVLLVPLVPPDPLELLEPAVWSEQVEHQELTVHPETRELMESSGHRDLRDPLEWLVLQGNPVAVGQQVPLELPGRLDRLEYLDQLVLRVLLVGVVNQVLQDK